MPKNNHSEFMRCYKKYVAVFKRKGKPKKSDTVALIDEFNLYPDLDDKENKAESDEKKYKKFLRTIKYNNLEIFNTWADRAIREYMETHPPQTVEELKISIHKLSKIVHLSPHTIRNTINHSGLNPFYEETPERRNSRINAQRLYRNGKSPDEIAAELSVTREQAIRYLIQENVSREELSQFNGNCVYPLRDVLSLTLENAHLWGLIWADGSISSKASVIIRLSKKDHDYLEAISQSIALDKSLHYPLSEVEENRSREGFQNVDDCWQLNISRKFIVDQLHSFGLPFNKTENALLIPEMIKSASDEFFFEFLRGFFEGDGSIILSGPSIGFSVDYLFGKALEGEIFRRIGIASSQLIEDKTIYRLEYKGIPKVLVLLMHIYRNAGVIMQRKADKAKALIEESCTYLCEVDRQEFAGKLTIVNLDKFALIESVFKSHLKDLIYNITLENINDGRLLSGLKDDILRETGISLQKLYTLETKARASSKGWKLVSSDKFPTEVIRYNNRLLVEPISLIKDDGQVYSGTLGAFLNMHPDLKVEYIRRVQNGVRNEYLGWKVYQPLDANAKSKAS